jgi:hypothetical protein
MDFLDHLTTYDEAKDLALRMLQRLAQPVSQVCGPLTTGGRGTFEANVEMLHLAIQSLTQEGHIVFDQRPFEIPMRKLVQAHVASGGRGYDYSLLERFYLPLFASGLIKQLYFLPGWESSIGASWEHQRGKELGLEIFYLSDSFLSGHDLTESIRLFMES